MDQDPSAEQSPNIVRMQEILTVLDAEWRAMKEAATLAARLGEMFAGLRRAASNGNVPEILRILREADDDGTQ